MKGASSKAEHEVVLAVMCAWPCRAPLAWAAHDSSPVLLVAQGFLMVAAVLPVKCSASQAAKLSRSPLRTAFCYVTAR